MKRSLSLYRKYRPQKFSELLGQPGAVTILQRALREDRVSHAYLFSGPRGCGKTSMARIFAKALNCRNLEAGPEPCGVCASCESIRQGDNLDVVEIDAASNRGIDEIRELKEQVALAPYGERWKVYIIDEVHMLTEHAFNALLKTLEEPPEYALFILATTEPHKVPVTIRSRCQHLPFSRISGEVMAALLEKIARKEGAQASPEALWEIARSGDGALRDAISLLEQALVLKEETLTLSEVQRLLGGSGRKEIEDLVALLRESPGEAYARFHELLGRGGSVVRLYEGLFRLLADLWTVSRWGEKAAVSLDVSEKEKEYLLFQAPLWKRERLWGGMDFLSHWLPRLRMGIDGELLGALLWGKLTEDPPSAKEISSGESLPKHARPHDGNASSEEGRSSLREKPRESFERSAPSRREASPGEFSHERSPLFERSSLSSEKSREAFPEEPPGSFPEPLFGEPSAEDSPWKKLLRRLYAETPWICAALIDLEPLVREEEMRLEFPLHEGEHRYLLVSSSAGQEALRSLFREFFGEVPLVLVRGKSLQRCFSGISPEKPSFSSSPKDVSSDSFEGDPEKRREAPKEHAPEFLFEDFPLFEELSEGDPGSFQPSDSGSEREESSSLGTLLSSLGGEILLEKREGAEHALLDEVEGDLPDHEE